MTLVYYIAHWAFKFAFCVRHPFPELSCLPDIVAGSRGAAPEEIPTSQCHAHAQCHAEPADIPPPGSLTVAVGNNKNHRGFIFRRPRNKNPGVYKGSEAGFGFLRS